MLKKLQAFTLIELMLTLIVVAILAVMIYPSYSHYVASAQRNRAEVALMQWSAQLEDYFSDQGTYKNADREKWHMKNGVRGLDYRLTILTLSDRHFLLEAIPTGAQIQRDARCGHLFLSDMNERKISGNGSVSQCWQ